MKNIIEAINQHPLIFDGAMGTVIYDKGIFVNTCYDMLNLTNPKLIKEIHREYVIAGCDVILTNTFGANRIKLKRFGLLEHLYEINFQGVKIAKEVATPEVFVLGCVGTYLKPGQMLTNENRKDIELSYNEQIKALKDGGVDGIIFETFTNLYELKMAAKIAKQMNLPVVACMTLNKELETLEGYPIEKALINLDNDSNIDILGLNCTIGPVAMLSAIEKVIKYIKKPFIVEPNAGIPQSIDGRLISMNTPEYFSTYAQNYVKLGVKGVGGCCGTTYKHIQEMAKAVKSLTGVKQHIQIQKAEADEEQKIIPTLTSEKSNFAKKLYSGEKATTIEITPPRSIDLKPMIEKVRICKANGIDAINLPDGPRASARISSMVAAIMIEKEVGMETILHYCCRDRNLIGMQSDLLGGYAAGIKNYLIITGDPPKLGDYPDATAVFDVDSVGLTQVVSNLNKGKDVAGNIINPPTSILIGVGANPCAIDWGREIEHYFNKIEAGAEYAITQPVFDADALLTFLDKIEVYDKKIPIIAGIWPLVSYKNATFLKNEVPGVVMPDKVIERMEKAQSKEDGIKIGIEIAQEIKEKIASRVNGYQISAPFGNVDIAIKVLK